MFSEGYEKVQTTLQRNRDILLYTIHMLDTWAGQCSFESPEYKTNKNDSQELDAPTPITQLYNVSNPDKSI